MISMADGVKGLLKNVIIDNSHNSGMSVDMGKDVTVSGCTIKDTPAG